MYDVIVVGGGPAGLSAALMLGRCRRSVLVCDSGRPRNAAARAVNGYLTRDGISPLDFRTLGRRELERYETVTFREIEVTGAECRDGQFHVTLAGGERVSSRKLLVATGVADNLPEVEGIHEFYGSSVFHCPYCDGWEFRDAPVAVYGKGENGVGLSLELKAWTHDIVLCTDGPSEIDDTGRKRLARNGIELRDARLARLEGRDGMLERVVFADGASLPRRALFFTLGQVQQSPLAVSLGCEISDKGTVRTGKYETTHLKGLFVAGDASRKVQWVVVAAAEGAEAAFAINTDLTKEDLA